MTKKEYKKVAKLLRNAKKLMNSKGKHWTKGSWYDKELNAYCSLGGLNKSAGHDPQNPPSHDHILAEAKICLAEYMSGTKRGKLTNDDYLDWAEDVIMEYNDSHKTTWGNVARKFGHAARKAEKLANG